MDPDKTTAADAPSCFLHGIRLMPRRVTSSGEGTCRLSKNRCSCRFIAISADFDRPVPNREQGGSGNGSSASVARHLLFPVLVFHYCSSQGATVGTCVT